MTTIALHSIPLDEFTPYPVNVSRIYETLVAQSHHPRVVNPHSTLSVHVEGRPFLIHLGRGATYLSVRTAWDTGVPYPEAAEPLFAATDTWNRERYFPTVYAVETSAHTAQLVADYLVDGNLGLSGRQLANTLKVGISTGADAIAYLKQATRKLLDRCPQSDE